MSEASTPPVRARALALVALAAAALSACADQPTGIQPTDSEDLHQVTAVQDMIVPGRVLVKFVGDQVPSTVQDRYGDRIRAFDVALRLGAVEVPVGREVEVARELSRTRGVVYAEPDYIRTLNAAPNDLYFGYKWGLHNDGTINSSVGDELATTGAVDADIDWLEAYESLIAANTSFQYVTMAILDTGIQQDHEDLASKIAGQYDFFDDDPDATDDNGHGSHTAGIAGAIGDNGKGVTGVAWHAQAELLVAKVCGPINPFQYGCPSSGTAAAIRWAADNGARVINLSLGGASGSSAERDALQYALSKETLAFCATGNDNSVVSYPAAFPECVAVGATDWGDNRASYSNFGPETEISAPGGDTEDPSGYSFILSSYEGGPTAYAFAYGTSMATPMATGLGGLLASLGVSTAAEIRSIMTSTVDDLGPNGRDDAFGHGRINANAAVAAVTGGGGDPTNGAPTASFSYSCTDLSCSFDGTASSDPDGDALSYDWTFGDGGSATGATTAHTYAAGGTYTVTLTVSDGSASDSESQSVTVTAPSSGITLSASGYKVRGVHTVDLTWSGASSADVDVYRDGGLLTTTANDGAYTDSTGNRGGATYTYQVCEAGTSTCSGTVTVQF
jgi:serine protease